MGIPHKAFDFKGIVILLALIPVFFASQAVAQENPLFVVEGVNVDVTAENSVAAQQKAFEEAQVKAFVMLAQRMVESSGAKPMKTPDAITVASMIKDFEVTNEQVSAVRYVGTYTFRFRESDVTNYFSISGVNYTATVSKTLLVLPFLQEGNRSAIWAENNVWLAAWSRAKLPPSLVPVEVPIGDLMDVGDLNDSQGLNYDMARLAGMQSRYGAGESAILIATPDSTLADIAGDADKAVGSLEVGIYRTDLGAPQFVNQVSVAADGAESRAQLYDRAVLMAYQALQKDWKTKTVTSAANKQGYEVKIVIDSLKDWVRIRRNLTNVPGMESVDVSSLSPREARAMLNFRGDEQRLREMLAQSGMGLGDGIPDGEGIPFYELQVDAVSQGSDFYQPPAPAGDEPSAEMSPDHGFYQGPSDTPSMEPSAGGEPSADDMVHTF